MRYFETMFSLVNRAFPIWLDRCENFPKMPIQLFHFKPLTIPLRRPIFKVWLILISTANSLSEVKPSFHIDVSDEDVSPSWHQGCNWDAYDHMGIPKWMTRYNSYNYFSDCVVFICDFHREQALEKWLSKTSNGCREIKDQVLVKLRKIARSSTVKESEKEINALKSSFFWMNKKYRALVQYVERSWLSMKTVSSKDTVTFLSLVFIGH